MESTDHLLPTVSNGSPPLLPVRSFIYPIIGIPHLLRHPSLHPPVKSRIFPLTILSLFILILFFTVLYIPHVILLTFLHGPLAWTNAALMILSEVATVVAIIAEALMTEAQIVDVFDTIVIESGGSALVRGSRDINPDGTLGKHRKDPYLKWKESGRITGLFVLELPLNLIPLVGTPLFLLLQGYHLGPLQHYRYWQLLGWTEDERRDFVKRNRGRYTAFGVVHVLLQLVPVLSIFFLFSTGAGAALWAVEAERRKGGGAWRVQREEVEGQGRRKPRRWWNYFAR